MCLQSLFLYVDLDCNRFSGAPCPPSPCRRRKPRFSGSLPRQPAHFVRLSSWRHQGEVPPVVTYFALIKQNPQFEARAQHAVLMRMMRFSPSSQKIFALQIFFGSPDGLTDCFGCGSVCLSRRPRRAAPRVTRAAQPPSSALPPTCIKTVTQFYGQ